MCEMIKKCKNCGRRFNTGTFSEEYCPYCGTMLDEKDRKKVRDREYFFRNTFFIILGCLLFASIMVLIIVNNVK